MAKEDIPVQESKFKGHVVGTYPQHSVSRTFY